MRRFLVTLLLLLIVLNVAASASLYVEAIPYQLILAIAGPQGNQIVTITIASSTEKRQWSINASDCKEAKYNEQQELLEITYEQANKSGDPPSFSLAIKGNTGLLKVGGHRYTATCDWKI